MMEFIIFTSPIILIISLITVIMSLSARFISNKFVHSGLYISSFLCVVGCSVYALLLGVGLNELLAYILSFTLLGLTSFIPIPTGKELPADKIEEKSVVKIPDSDLSDTDGAQEANCSEQELEEKADEL